LSPLLTKKENRCLYALSSKPRLKTLPPPSHMYLAFGLLLIAPVALFVWLGGMRYIRIFVGAADKKMKRRSGEYQKVGTEADLESK